SYLINSYVYSVQKIFDKNNIYKSPNSVTDMMVFYIKKYENGYEDSHLVISNLIAHNYPLLINLQKENYLKYAVSIAFDPFGFENKTIFSVKIHDRAFVYSYLFDDLKKQIQNKKIKVVFVGDITRDLQEYACTIGILEYYFKDVEFKKLFFENFYFKNRFVDYQKNEKSPKIRNLIARSEKLLSRDFEIYVRK
ncbi:MAG TPA: hypothetical protein VI861_00095, partial [Rickettsiales bacterium]|nr:hypothetical protein [Rickettsiales bacterium]